jgi:hypothetical protein
MRPIFTPSRGVQDSNTVSSATRTAGFGSLGEIRTLRLLQGRARKSWYIPIPTILLRVPEI